MILNWEIVKLAKEKQMVWQIPLTRKQAGVFLAALLLSAALVRLILGYTAVHYFDLGYYVDWSSGVLEDFFDAYDRIENLDYPPLFLFPLYFTGWVMSDPRVSEFHPYAMLALKGWQMLFDLALIPMLYLLLRRHSELFGLLGAALWAVNPTILYNSAYWGQTDSIMLFLLALAFSLLDNGRPVWSSVTMALACLMKFQSLYFAPLFALVLFTRYPFRRAALGGCAAVATAFAVFLPFMLRSGWDLPFRVYFGGFAQYPGASLNAFNLYSAEGLNYASVATTLVGPLTVGGFSACATAAALLLLAYFYLTATEKSVWLLGFWFMQTVFLFTARMHERYQIPVLLFALLASVVHRSYPLFWGYAALTAITFFNHFLVLEEAFAGDPPKAWTLWYGDLVEQFSWANLAVYALTAAVCLHILYRRGRISLREGIQQAGSYKF